MMAALFTQLFLISSLVSFFSVDVALLEQRQKNFVSLLPFEQMEKTFFSLQESSQIFLQPIPQKKDVYSLGVLTSAKSAVVVDAQTGSVLFAKNLSESRSIGSITKLMTALVFLEDHPDLSLTGEILPTERQTEGKEHLPPEDPVTRRDLLIASLVGSDNSASITLARISGKSLEEFVKRMNTFAKEIGMEQTVFVDPTGLSSDNRSVVLDVVKLLQTALENPVIKDIIAQPYVSIEDHLGRTSIIQNTNELLTSFLSKDPYTILGGKTGFLPEAGYCLGISLQKEGTKNIYIVVLGSQTSSDRFQDVKSLAVWVYDQYEWPL